MPAQLDPPKAALAERMNGAGRYLRLSARPHIHEAKAAIVAEMGELDRPVTSSELYARLDRAWSLRAIEYHLSTLVKAKIVEIVVGRELRFRLTRGDQRIDREWMPLVLTDGSARSLHLGFEQKDQANTKGSELSAGSS